MMKFIKIAFHFYPKFHFLQMEILFVFLILN